MAQDLLENLFKKRDAWRKKMDSARILIKWKDLQWEVNKQGKMK